MTKQMEQTRVGFDPIPYTEISDPTVLVKAPLVSAMMITYNHAPYIAKAIEGVITQKTSFPIELIIGEDCSTDDTRDIVLEYQRRYPWLIRVIYSDRNVGMRRNHRRIYEAVRGEFIAICEGDDQWIDDRKLEKQVSVMMSEPNCSIASHAVKIYRLTKGTTEIRRYGACVKSFSLDEVVLAGGGFILTGSIMVRATSVNPIPKWVYECEIGDYPFVVHCASRGGVIYLPEVMSIYRMGIPGSWTVQYTGFEKQKRTLDSILVMLDKFLQERGNDVAETVRKAKETFIIYLYMFYSEHPPLQEQGQYDYRSCLSREGRALVFLTRFYVLRRMIKLVFRFKERVRRHVSGRKVSIKPYRVSPQGDA